MNLAIISIVLAAASNILYHLFQKGLAKDVNPFLLLGFTYASALVTTCIILFFTVDKQTLYSSIKTMNILLPVGLGIAIVGLELGFLFAYRAGWNMTLAVLYVNIIVTVVLIPLGIFMYAETFSVKNFIGVIMSILGITLIASK